MWIFERQRCNYVFHLALCQAGASYYVGFPDPNTLMIFEVLCNDLKLLSTDLVSPAVEAIARFQCPSHSLDSVGLAKELLLHGQHVGQVLGAGVIVAIAHLEAFVPRHSPELFIRDLTTDQGVEAMPI